MPWWKAIRSLNLQVMPSNIFPYVSEDGVTSPMPIETKLQVQQEQRGEGGGGGCQRSKRRRRRKTSLVYMILNDTSPAVEMRQTDTQTDRVV